MGSMTAEPLSPKDLNSILFDSLPASLPEVHIPNDVNADAIATDGVRRLSQLCRADLANSIVWRDLCALTGCFRTFYGAERVSVVWEKVVLTHQPTSFKLVPGTAEIVRAGDRSSWILAAYTFQCLGEPKTQCSGLIGLIPDVNDKEWKIWLFTTLLEELEGYPSPDRVSKSSDDTVKGSTLGAHSANNEVIQCVVVGAGFSGLAIAGRLHAMGIKVAVLEKNPELGDNWKNRYDSARFHTTKAYSDLPLGRMFTDEEHIFPGRLDLIRMFKRYADFHSLNIWCSSSLRSASYDPDAHIWTLAIDQSGVIIEVQTQHLVLAIGGLGAIPKFPNLPNRELYKGHVMHSFHYKSAKAWKGLRAVVVGSANTAHDVAEDMVEAELASVTLIQRTPTPVFPIEWYKKLMDSHYSVSSDIEIADRRTISLPVAVARLMGIEYYKKCMGEEPERLDALERAGFAIERSGDMVKCAFGDGAGGHHTDVGGGSKIIANQIKVKSLASPIEYTETGLRFADGSHLEADVVVFCTGFHTNMLPEAVKILGLKMESQLEDFWGIDNEGELRGAFKRMKQPGVWFIGGGAPWARFGSRFLALQIQADLIGKSLPVYRDH